MAATLTLKLREDWLNRLARLMEPKFKELGHPLPSYRVSCGFTSKGARSKRIGECWAAECSKDAHHEVFIHPGVDDPMEVASILCHELIHAAVGIKEGHGAKFKATATSFGLVGPAKSTTHGPEFESYANGLLLKVGAYPHAKLESTGVSSLPPSRSGRLVKLLCAEDSGFKVYMVRGDINRQGYPLCPCCEQPMVEALG